MIVRAPGGARMVRALLASLLLLAIPVLPALAVSGPTSLSSPVVTPAAGTTSTTVTFEVTYRNSEGSPPDYVHLRVAGSTLAMTAVTGSGRWGRGVRFSVAAKLPVGKWPTTFEAVDREKFTATITGPTVTISPPPTPAPTPHPTPAPTPHPTPTPVPAPTPTPSPRGSATPQPTTVPVATPQPGASPSPAAPPATAAPPAAATFGATPGPTPSSGAPGAGQTPAAPASPSPSPSLAGGPGLAVVDPGGTNGGTGGTNGGTDGTHGSGPGGDGAASLPGGTSGLPGVMAALARVTPAIVVTSGGVAMAMAFLVFGKRRRDQEPTAPDAVLGASAARGSGVVASSGLVPAMSGAAAAAVRAAVIAAPAPGDVDSHLPRWRRPSLIEARKTDPLRAVAASSVRLTFDGDVGAAVTGLERRRIRYRMVGLLSDPDEVRGVETGTLDEGDEVVLLEKRGTHWRVLCPDGREGWLHKMVLGEIVADPSDAGAGSWTSGDDGPVTGSFEDVLRSYTEKRSQFGGI